MVFCLAGIRFGAVNIADLSQISLDTGSVDDGDITVAVNVRVILIEFTFCEFKARQITLDIENVKNINCLVIVDVALCGMILVRISQMLRVHAVFMFAFEVCTTRSIFTVAAVAVVDVPVGAV